MTVPSSPDPRRAPILAAALRRGRRTVLLSTVLGLVLCLVAAAAALSVASPSRHLLALGAFLLLLRLLRGLTSAERLLRTASPASPGLSGRVASLAALAGLPAPEVRSFAPAAKSSPGKRLVPAVLSGNACAVDDLTPGTTVLVGVHLQGALHELEEDAILGHEVAHLAHGSARLTLLGILGQSVWTVAFYVAVLAVLLLGDGFLPRVLDLAVLLLVAYSLAAARSFLSRRAEHAADETGAVLCGSRLNLASALVRVETLSPVFVRLVLQSRVEQRPLGDLVAASGAVVEPPSPLGRSTVLEAADGFPRRGLLTRLFASHPPTPLRVRRLLR